MPPGDNLPTRWERVLGRYHPTESALQILRFYSLYADNLLVYVIVVTGTGDLDTLFGGRAVSPHPHFPCAGVLATDYKFRPQ